MQALDWLNPSLLSSACAGRPSRPPAESPPGSVELNDVTSPTSYNSPLERWTSLGWRGSTKDEKGQETALRVEQDLDEGFFCRTDLAGTKGLSWGVVVFFLPSL